MISEQVFNFFCTSNFKATLSILYVSVFQLVCCERVPGVPQKISEKNYLGTLNFTVFVCEISEIWSKDGFFLKRTNFGKKLTRKNVNSGEDFCLFSKNGGLNQGSATFSTQCASF